MGMRDWRGFEKEKPSGVGGGGGGAGCGWRRRHDKIWSKVSDTVIEQSIFYPFSALSLSLSVSANLCKEEEEKCEWVTSTAVFFFLVMPPNCARLVTRCNWQNCVSRASANTQSCVQFDGLNIPFFFFFFSFLGFV